MLANLQDALPGAHRRRAARVGREEEEGELMPYGLSFSWRRAIGASAAKARLSRSIGIPLTRSGRERKAGRLVTSSLGAGVVAIAWLILSRL
jgi:hypothetical protein